MDIDLVTVLIGLFFIAWYWLFPVWLLSLRKRIAAKGDLEDFDRRFPREAKIVGRYVVPALGLAVVVLGVVF